MTITLTPEMEQALQDEAAKQGKTPEQLAMEAMLAGLRDRRIPQSLDELAPRKPLPPGKTLKDVLADFSTEYPSDETDEEVQRALEALS